MTNNGFEHPIGIGSGLPVEYCRPDGEGKAPAAMTAREFRDDDADYGAWLATHRDGYVINIARNHNAAAARVHHAYCRTINGQHPHSGTWTAPYIKVCAQQLAELDQWVNVHVGNPIRRCGTCHPV